MCKMPHTDKKASLFKQTNKNNLLAESDQLSKIRKTLKNWKKRKIDGKEYKSEARNRSMLIREVKAHTENCVTSREKATRNGF